MPHGLLFKADELRDADTRIDEYNRRVCFIESRTRRLQPQDFTETSASMAWWIEAGQTIARKHQRATAGFTFLEKLGIKSTTIARQQNVFGLTTQTSTLAIFPKKVSK